MLLEAFPGQGGKNYNSKTPEVDLLKESITNHKQLIKDFTNLNFQRIAGNSYGIYGAMVAAGSVDEEEAIELVQLRADIVRNAERSKPEALRTGMMTLIGVNRQKAEEIAREFGIFVTNDYGPNIQVVGGLLVSLNGLQREKDLLNLKTKLLPIEGAYHCILREEDSRLYAEKIGNRKFRDPKLPMYSSTNPRILYTGSDLMEELVSQMIYPVESPKIVEIALAEGVNMAIDVGPGTNMQRLLSESTDRIQVLSFEKDRNQIAQLT